MLVLHEPPEQAEEREAEHIDGPLHVQRAEKRLRKLFRVRGLRMSAQVFLAGHERKETDDHADTGRPEAVLPAEGFAEPAAKKRGRKRSDVDAHVEDREPGIAARVFRGIELADDGRDVRLEVTDTHHDERQRQVEDLERRGVADRDVLGQDGAGREHLSRSQRQILEQPGARGIEHGLVTLDGHENVTQRQQYAAEQNGLAHPEITVGDQPADQRQRVHETGIGAEDIEAHLVGKEVILGEIQDQEELHSVERKTLP